VYIREKAYENSKVASSEPAFQFSVVMDSQKIARPSRRIASVALGARTTISMALNL
jgi:hypothetical protein